MNDHMMNGVEMRKRSCLTPLLLGSDIEFRDISYSVPEGRRKKGIYDSINGLVIVLTLQFKIRNEAYFKINQR